MSTMKYKGFAARVEYSEEDGCFIGRLAGIRDVIGVHGESVAELRAAFEEAFDDCLATCKKIGTIGDSTLAEAILDRLVHNAHKSPSTANR